MLAVSRDQLTAAGRVRCDEGRPSCQRCIKRNDICEGYRDEATIIFRHETVKVIEHARASAAYFSPSSSSGSLRRSRSEDGLQESRRSSLAVGSDPSDLTQEELDAVPPGQRLPWLKEAPSRVPQSVEDQAVDRFMEKYVMYPCNETSSPGFLEHLPGLFKDVNVPGRFALRWAVRAAGYADLSQDSDGDKLSQKALHCYGMALSALGESLAEPGKAPDDYDLMTVVVLDVFETLFLPESARAGAHAQGMAQILRLRGSEQVYSPRGWSLFRLAHHRIQKQQLAFGMPQLTESKEWLDQLNDDINFVAVEKDAFMIKETCQRAQELLNRVQSQDFSPDVLLEMAQEMVALDQAAASWRQSSEWNFKSGSVPEMLRPQQLSTPPITEYFELHADVWRAYEWNYHRTGRIIFHQQVLTCLEVASKSSTATRTVVSTINEMVEQSITTVRQLADGVLATVPQSFGDIDHLGNVHDIAKGPPKCRAVGAYLLLWPIKIIKGPDSRTTFGQKERAQVVFERIREYTGMKAKLGNLSCI
ncbi:uncharacterized protein JN550_002506 [Neoarthrinium moseri]|uniref:uncharacterized protein n=1 Tax=Neoarthrinium moseri TaxID=1658444 RepID=UPI001FDC8FEA|nr:uncharacterized protein JN550_002506 [Neoarthrinium moseri]KAI1875077.1 hypothetical protein JN550_002506 [Neoarthrinium moseri]